MTPSKIFRLAHLLTKEYRMRHPEENNHYAVQFGYFLKRLQHDFKVDRAPISPERKRGVVRMHDMFLWRHAA